MHFMAFHIGDLFNLKKKKKCFISLKKKIRIYSHVTIIRDALCNHAFRLERHE